ncbi:MULTISPECIES: DHHW family protein [Lachnospiraceae]|uniref:DHHW family protein n=1 Tax=Faecalicatena acetigenes TaxID=2981790 RepID=A0ABT2T843_9FIRM|nr:MULTISPECIES: DHHW family protein [Lachnospiraceae]MCU6746445.1 DHHW family protein [Faecalicatena acetigenes]RGT72627.1 hypothetical protein DWX08_09075 [Ruminococcus sp. AF18-22]SCH18546.1 Uncharacterised protein [uncultured Clostridium sp.]
MGEKNRKKKGKIENLIGTIFILCLLLIMVLNILLPDKEMSEEENRMLTEKPKLDWSSVTGGNFMESYENYLSDQFVGRNAWRSVKIFLDRLGGSREENGVLIGRKGQLLEKIEVPDKENLSANIEAIQGFMQAYPDIPVSMLLVPDAANILSDTIPPLATVEDQTQLINQVRKELGESVNWVDAVSVLNKHKSEKIYYKTDPHWTALGAFYTFHEAAKALDIDKDFASGYVAHPVTDSFNGTLAAKSGVNLDVKETIDIYVPKDEDNDVIVNYVDEQRRTTSIYDSAKLKTRDKYGVYLGGNSSVIDIKTVSSSSRRLLLVKDSFANCFVQFLTPYFREIILVDPRYYGGNIQNIMENYRITDVMFLYSGNTFFSDNSISGVFASE